LVEKNVVQDKTSEKRSQM